MKVKYNREDNLTFELFPSPYTDMTNDVGEVVDRTYTRIMSIVINITFLNIPLELRSLSL